MLSSFYSSIRPKVDEPVPEKKKKNRCHDCRKKVCGLLSACLFRMLYALFELCMPTYWLFSWWALLLNARGSLLYIFIFYILMNWTCLFWRTIAANLKSARCIFSTFFISSNTLLISQVGLNGFECKCGFMYCNSHRYPDQHSCQFDHKVSIPWENVLYLLTNLSRSFVLFGSRVNP